MKVVDCKKRPRSVYGTTQAIKLLPSDRDAKKAWVAAVKPTLFFVGMDDVWLLDKLLAWEYTESFDIKHSRILNNKLLSFWNEGLWQFFWFGTDAHSCVSCVWCHSFCDVFISKGCWAVCPCPLQAEHLKAAMKAVWPWLGPKRSTALSHCWCHLCFGCRKACLWQELLHPVPKCRQGENALQLTQFQFRYELLAAGIGICYTWLCFQKTAAKRNVTHVQWHPYFFIGGIGIFHFWGEEGDSRFHHDLLSVCFWCGDVWENDSCLSDLEGWSDSSSH